MLVIRVVRRPNGDIVGLHAEGHTGFDRRGRDIVCAGASAVVHTAVLGVTQAAGVPARTRTGDGYLTMELEPGDLPEDRWRQAQAVLEAAVLGVREIARQYPRHVAVVDSQAPEPAHESPAGRRKGGKAGEG